MSCLLKILHRYEEIGRGIENETWWRKDGHTGVRIPGSEFQRQHATIIHECRKCKDRIAFRQYLDDGKIDIPSLNVEIAIERIKKCNGYCLGIDIPKADTKCGQEKLATT